MDETDTREPPSLTPIAMLSFNRPALLRLVLASLRGQRGARIEDREVHLFQDGAVNRYSRLRYAESADIAASVAVFREIFPTGHVHASPDNIGVCENMLRAETFMFETLGAECAYFFEDDMVLSPAYVAMMDKLQWHCRNARDIAYFAAYGDYYADAESIGERRAELITLDHHWAFGLFRNHWQRIRSRLDAYYAIVLGNDYARRDHRAIYDLYRKLGASPRGSSQDAAKAFVCARVGLWRCRTVLPFAKYIGAEGAHMSRDLYESLGFDKISIAEEPLPQLKFPTDGERQAFVEEENRLYGEIFRNELDGIVATQSRSLDPLRPCTEQDVIAIYHLLLHRDPESREVVEQHLNGRPVAELVRAILDSPECKKVMRLFDP